MIANIFLIFFNNQQKIFFDFSVSNLINIKAEYFVFIRQCNYRKLATLFTTIIYTYTHMLAHV